MGRSKLWRASVVILLLVGSWVTGRAQASATTLHCFDQTGFCVSDPTVWDYFTHRGGVNTFGYPVTQEFLFEGFQTQFFQRRIVQIGPDGGARLLNVLDPGLMPYTQFNGAVMPGPDPQLVAAAPPATDQAAVLAFVQQYTPDTWEGMPVHFDQTFLNTVTAQTAFPDGGGNAALLPGFDLEMWGMPTSLPAVDPNNHNFVYQRFQRGVMMYDASTGLTQGVLLADYLKDIMTGQNLPVDLGMEACGNDGYGPSPFCEDYSPSHYTIVLAMAPDDPEWQAQLLAQIKGIGPCGRDYLMALYPYREMSYFPWLTMSYYPGTLMQVCQVSPIPAEYSLESFVYRVTPIHPQAVLAPGVADAMAQYQQLYGPIPTPTPRPYPSPVTSPNWAGYSAPGGGATGVRARWTEPSVTGTASDHVVAWVGLGGWGSTFNNIVQIGTLASIEPGGNIRHQVWYETLPPDQWNLRSTDVSPGDEISASVTLEDAATNAWRLTITDLTNGHALQITVHFPSDRAYADFIVEDPNATNNNGPPYYPLPAFNPVTFRQAEVRYAADWVSLDKVPTMQITLIRDGVELIRPNPLTNGTFTLTQIHR